MPKLRLNATGLKIFEYNQNGTTDSREVPPNTSVRLESVYDFVPEKSSDVLYAYVGGMLAEQKYCFLDEVTGKYYEQPTGDCCSSMVYATYLFDPGENDQLAGVKIKSANCFTLQISDKDLSMSVEGASLSEQHYRFSESKWTSYGRKLYYDPAEYALDTIQPGQYTLLPNQRINRERTSWYWADDMSGYFYTTIGVSASNLFPCHYGRRHTGHARVTIDGANPPYLEVEYEPVESFEITNRTPLSSCIDIQTANRFTWSLKSYTYRGNLKFWYNDRDYFITDPKQRSAQFQWRPYESSDIHTLELSGPDMFIEIPAYTFPPNTKIEWRVRVIDIHGTDSGFAPWLSLETMDGMDIRTVRIYAADSCEQNITATMEGREGEWHFEGDEIRGKTVGACTSYNFVARIDTERANSPPFNDARLRSGPDTIYGHKNCSGCRLTFDFNTVPALAGKRILSIDKLCLYLREKDLLAVRGYNVNTYCEFDAADVILTWLDGVPPGGSYPSGSSTGTENLPDVNILGNAAVNNYYNLYPHGLPAQVTEGIQKVDITVGAKVYPFKTNINYTGHLTAIFDSHFAEHRPYVEVTYANGGKLAVTNCKPYFGFVDEHQVSRFTWDVGPDVNAVGVWDQSYAEFQWRVAGSENVNILTANNTGHFIDIPADTFPNAVLEWRIRAVPPIGMASDFTPWYQITTIDTPPNPPQYPTPDNRTINGQQDCVFSWVHSVATNSLPSGFEIQYSYDAVNWIPLVEEKSAAQQYLVPGGMFRTGYLYWRVRTYNSDGVVSAWSKPAFLTIIGAPNAPENLRSNRRPRTLVQWEANIEQTAYHVVAGAFDSGEVVSVENRCLVPLILPDGDTRFQARIRGSNGLWSGWASVTESIQNVPGPALLLRTSEMPNCVRLSWDPSDAFEGYWLYRDGDIIARLSGSSYTDYRSSGAHTYQVFGLLSDGGYSKSPETVAVSRVQSAVLAVVGVYEWLSAAYRLGSPPAHSETHKPEIVLKSYSGRALPVADVFSRRQVSHSFTFSLDNRAAFHKLQAMLAKTVVYKNDSGLAVIGLLDSVKVTDERPDGVTVDLSITETEQMEEEPYVS